MSIKYRYNRDADVVSVEFDDVIVQSSFVEFYARTFVTEHMKYDGIFESFLSDADWQNYFLMCDGFGVINGEYAKTIEWDWSHVRDSGDKTLVEVADEICQNHWKESLESHIETAIANADELGVNPLRFVPNIDIEAIND